MLVNLLKIGKSFNVNLLCHEIVLYQQLRTTYILKRKHPPLLWKKGSVPQRLRPRHYIYELVKTTSAEKKPDLNVILLKHIEGIGNPGDHVSVPATYGYNKLLLPGRAVYATPENVEKYRDLKTFKEEITYSSPFAHLTSLQLSNMLLSVVMNKHNPWTLQKWHIRNSFRKCGYIVPEDTITMPDKPISGPDMNLQNKEFYVTVIINNSETVRVRCVIHHWSSVIGERLLHLHEFWKQIAGPIFPEDEAVLAVMPAKGSLKKHKL